MQELSYQKPAGLSEALALMEKHGAAARPYAGGTDLMVQLREGAKRLAGVGLLVDLGGLPELRGISAQGGAVSIGAMESHTALSTSAVLAEHAPFLAKASSTVGSPQIRNNGTVGGNICNASPAADTLSPLAALDAVLVVCGASGTRSVPLAQAYDERGNLAFAPGEVLTRITFESLAGWSTCFLKLGRRKALAISRMNVAVALKMENGVITGARIAPGCVFRAPGRVNAAEALLLDKAPGRELFDECGRMVGEEMVARTGVRWSTEYKQPVVAALVRRALEAAAGGVQP